MSLYKPKARTIYYIYMKTQSYSNAKDTLTVIINLPLQVTGNIKYLGI